MQLQDLIIFSTLLICFTATFFGIKTIIENTFTHSFPAEVECKNLNEFIDTKKKFSVTRNLLSLWNFKISMNDLPIDVKVELLMTCPSYYQDAELVLGGDLISRTVSSLFNYYYVEDCHRNQLFYVDELTYKKSPNIKDYYVYRRIMSPDAETVYGYVARKELLEPGFSIIDDNQKVIAKVFRNHFSITYEVDIYEEKHPVADPRLILLLIAKSAFNLENRINGKNEKIYDLCNEVYDWFNIFYYILLIASPVLILYMMVATFFPRLLNNDNQSMHSQAHVELVEEKSKNKDHETPNPIDTNSNKPII